MTLKFTRIRRDGHLPVSTVVSPATKARLEELRTELTDGRAKLTMSETVSYVIRLGLESYQKVAS